MYTDKKLNYRLNTSHYTLYYFFFLILNETEGIIPQFQTIVHYIIFTSPYHNPIILLKIKVILHF